MTFEYHRASVLVASVHVVSLGTWLLVSFPCFVCRTDEQRGSAGSTAQIGVGFNLGCQALLSWVHCLTWVLKLSQVIVIFGPTEAFHVPFFGQSKTTVYAELLRRRSEKGNGRSVFRQLLQVLSIEKQAKEAVPDLSFGGSCSWVFLGFVHSIPWPGHPLDDVVVGDSPGLLSANRTGELGEVWVLIKAGKW